MKYIITESKLEETITNYFYELFPVDNIHSTHPEQYDGETGEYGEDQNRIIFYISDYDDGADVCFRWYDCEHFHPDSNTRNLCPTVAIEISYGNKLKGYFGDVWQEPFKKWFTKNFDLPVKTVD